MGEQLRGEKLSGVVGSGDIASVLPERDDLLFFAAGVSNSQETRESEYQREVDLLLEQPRDAHIVYFGSLAIFYSDTLYAQHKRAMEELVRSHFTNYTIIRLGNTTFGKNPNTIINFLKQRIADDEPFEVQDVERYLVGEEELLYWIGMIPPFPCEINVPGERVKVQEIVDRIKKGEL